MNIPHAAVAGGTAAAAAMGEITVVVDVTAEVVGSNHVVVVEDDKADSAGVELILMIRMDKEFVEELRDFGIPWWDTDLVEG